MDNLYQTQQLIIDLRRSKEADARRYRLVRNDRIAANRAARPCARRHGIAFFARQSLARA
jgi:hypothetical protein